MQISKTLLLFLRLRLFQNYIFCRLVFNFVTINVLSIFENILNILMGFSIFYFKI